MDTRPEVIDQLQTLLDRATSAKTKDEWEKYLRHAIPFRGVGIPEIRGQLAEWRKTNGDAAWPATDQLRLALSRFESGIPEDKPAGTLFLKDNLYDRFAWEMLPPEYEQLSRVLGPTIASHDLPCAEAIAAWRHAPDLWQAGSSVVAFIPLSADARYNQLAFGACETLIQREERFAKTAAGWILHGLSRHDKARVARFVEEHIRHCSFEALKNALKYYDKVEQAAHLNLL